MYMSTICYVNKNYRQKIKIDMKVVTRWKSKTSASNECVAFELVTYYLFKQQKIIP